MLAITLPMSEWIEVMELMTRMMPHMSHDEVRCSMRFAAQVRDQNTEDAFMSHPHRVKDKA